MKTTEKIRFLLTALLGMVNLIASAQVIAFSNVTVIDVQKGVAIPAMTVVIDGERIAEVGLFSTIEISSDATVIDATGRFLIPGLWDMHVHTGSDKDTRRIMYPLLIAHGITGIRNMHGDCFECGKDFSIEQLEARRSAIASGELIGPMVIASSRFAGSHEQAANRPTEGSSPQAPATEEDARAFVRLVKERGIDFIKVYDMLPREAYFALADEANKLELPFAGHVPIEVRASEASDAGQRSIEHLGMGNFLEECSSREKELRRRVIVELYKAEMGSRVSSDGPALLPLMLEMVKTYDAEKCLDLAERFARNETWIVPTLMVSRLPGELGKDWREDPYVKFLSSEERQIFEELEETYERDMGNAQQRAPISQKIREALKVMSQAGVRIMAGTDAGDAGVFWGISLHQELELLVKAGLSEAEALRAATLGPAEFLRITDVLGTIEKGKIADLVLLDANPLKDISNTQKIHAVVLKGQYFDRQALDKLLEEAENAAK